MCEKISKKKQPTKIPAIEKAKDELMALPHNELSTPGCKFGKTFLNIDQSVSEEDYFKLGQDLLSIKGTLQWWIGDWINAGKEKYSRNKYDIALYKFHYTYGTLANIASICEKVKSSCRHENLSFEHHRAVAPLPPEEQVFWLDNAEKPPDRVYGKWSVRELWKRIIDTRLLAEKSDYLKETKDKYFIYISTKDNVHNYSEYIKLLNRSVKSLTNKIKRLLEYKPYSGFSEKIKPQFCKTDEEREFSKNCSRLFWNLEWLLDEQLSKLTLLKDSPFDEPLLLEEVAMGFPAFMLTEVILLAPWVTKYMKNGLSEIYPHECLFAESRKLADLLNTDVKLLSKNFEKLFKIYDDDGDVMAGVAPLNRQVDGFKFTCYALILNLINLCKVINEYFPNPLDKETVESLRERLFDSGTEDEKKKSKIEGKVKELLEIIFEE